MKARLDELSYKELHPTIRALADGGFDKELADLVRKPGNAQRGVDAMRQELLGMDASAVTMWYKLLNACHQTAIDPDIKMRNFPFLDDGTKRQVRLYRLPDINGYSGYEAETELRKQGYKLVGIKKAMEYIAAHLNSQGDDPICVIGAQWQNTDKRVFMPYFWNNVGLRTFSLSPMDERIGSHCRYLVFHKQK